MKNLMKNWAVAIAIAFATTAMASADPLTISANLQSVFGESVSYTLGSTTKSTTAGRFNWMRIAENPATPELEAGSFPLDPIPSGDLFYSFCIDLSETVSIGGTYTWTVEEDLANGRDSAGYPALGPVIAGNIASFLGAVFPDIGGTLTTTNAAALQLAIWEIIYETSGTFDLTSGHFSSSTTAVTSVANGLLATFAAYQGPAATGLHALNNAGKQDQLIQIPGNPDTEVPEPGTYALMGTGLLLIGVFRRKFAR